MTVAPDLSVRLAKPVGRVSLCSMLSGIIKLESPIIVRAPYVTIAGQTAPGDGVCIAGESFWVNTHDVIVRHMRFRRGETKVHGTVTTLSEEIPWGIS